MKLSVKEKITLSEGVQADSKSYPGMGVIKGDSPSLISIYIVRGHITGRS